MSAKYPHIFKKANLISVSFGVVGVSYIVISYAYSPLIIIVLVFICGFALTLASTVWISMFHSNVSNNIKGRVFGIMSLIFGITQSISVFLSPLIVKYIGYQKFLFIAGIVTVIYYFIIVQIPKNKKYFDYNTSKI